MVFPTGVGVGFGEFVRFALDRWKTRCILILSCYRLLRT